MNDWLEQFITFIQGLSENHNIDPLIFGFLYVVTIPLYLGCLGWMVRNGRKGKPVITPLFLTILFFFLPAFYIALFGRNVSWYIYVILAAVIVYGAYSLRLKIKGELSQGREEA